MAASNLLAYGTSQGYFGVVEIREEAGVVNINHISNLHLLDVFMHSELDAFDLEVYGIKFINNSTRLLVGTSHGMLSVPTRDVDITQDCVWTDMTREETPCPKFVVNRDRASVIIINEMGLDIRRITRNGSLGSPWVLYAPRAPDPTAAEISCLETNLAQDLGLGRENGYVEAWHPASSFRGGPERVVSQKIGQHSVATLAMSMSWVCAVYMDEMDNVTLCGMDWLDPDSEGLKHQVNIVEVEGFFPKFCLFPQRDACDTQEVLPVILLDSRHAVAYDEFGCNGPVVLVEDLEDSVTCFAQNYKYICLGTERGDIKICPVIEGNLNSLAAANTFTLPDGWMMTCLSLSDNEPGLQQQTNEHICPVADKVMRFSGLV